MGNKDMKIALPDVSLFKHINSSKRSLGEYMLVCFINNFFNSFLTKDIDKTTNSSEIRNHL